MLSEDEREVYTNQLTKLEKDSDIESKIDKLIDRGITKDSITDQASIIRNNSTTNMTIPDALLKAVDSFAKKK